MSKTILNLCGAVLVLTVSGASWATEDRLNQLIQKIEVTEQSAVKAEHLSRDDKKMQLDRLEGQILGRASWDIRCKQRVYDDSTVCVMHKSPVTVVRIDNRYSVYIGENHQSNSNTEVRVDSNEVFKAREGLYRDAEQLINQFKKGYYVFTRYQQKNETKLVENKVSLIGFTHAFNDLEEKFKKQLQANSKL